MSWGSTAPRMSTNDDILFRAKVSARVRVEEGQEPGEWHTSYLGPYTKTGPARSAVTRERNKYERYYSHMEAVVELEACMPEWKIVE